MNQTSPKSRVWRGKWLVAGAVICLVLGGGAYWQFRETPSERARRELIQARYAYLEEHYERAEDLAQSALADDPELGEAALIAGKSAAKRQDDSKAARYLEEVVFSDPEIRIEADLLLAELYHQRLNRLGLAEDRYRSVLSAAPDSLPANAGLAALLGTCGRAREAAPFVLKQIQLGRPTDQLFLIARESGGVNDPQALKLARMADPDDRNMLLGLAFHAASEERLEEALGLLQKAARLHPKHFAVQIALGRQWLAAGKYNELLGWVNSDPAGAEDSGEYWLILGRLAEHQGAIEPAIRCYWESVKRHPESKRAYPHLIKLLSTRDADSDAKIFANYFEQLQQLYIAQDHVWSNPNPPSDAIVEMARAYERLGRVWEAYGWTLLALSRQPGDAKFLDYAEKMQRKLSTAPLKLTLDAANPARQIDLSAYPLPKFQGEPARSLTSPASDGPPPTFSEEAKRVGLAFRYFHGSSDPDCRRMFSFTGGGIGVLDFDADGYSDVFFSQGQPWPPNSGRDDHSGQLFLNRAGRAFENVSAAAGIKGTGFGQGVAVGDYNADGFPDLYLAQIGRNQIWLNNGDGTFTNESDAAGLSGHEWTTSCLCADLSGDGLPDLYDVNYLKGRDIFDRVCRHPDGSPALCMPFDFEAEADRFLLNTGDGRFVDVTKETFSAIPEGKGLGAIAWATEGTGRLSLLVANDTTLNFFYVPAFRDGKPFFEERGLLSGLACNAEGKAEGCMGIALADVDGNGLHDVHVTNFFAESNTLWLGRSRGLFEDATRVLGLQAPSLNMLGFGTQFLDADLDGRWELFVSNGHIDDQSAFGRPYEMPAQLFRWNHQQFVEIAADQMGEYFQEKWLGRAVARLDWNRDGLNDLLVGHLKADSALLTNTTENPGRFLTMKLVGTRSGRDAIGTTVAVRVGKRTYTQQLAADGGYHASNERRLVFGLGETDQIDEIRVSWLSGLVQAFPGTKTSQHLLLIEGRDLLNCDPD